MGARLKLNSRARALKLLFGILLMDGLHFSSRVCAYDNVQYNIIQEHQNCDHIIPQFISQVMTHKSSICQEQGEFPQPGNCTAFFKCVRSDKTIQPFVEYCSIGYNFVGGVCLPNTNSSDCPQYTCRISDGTNETGNDLTSNNDDEHVSGSGTISFTTHPPTTLPSVPSENVDGSAEVVGDNDILISPETSTAETVQAIHSEQLQSMQGTEEMPKNEGSPVFLCRLLFLSCTIFFVVQFIQA